MEYIKLGATDVTISKICFGCWAIGGHGYGQVNDSDSIKAIHTALDHGINFFDTADVYGFGHSEEVLGNALKGNADAVIATKFGVAWDAHGKTRKDCSVKHLLKAVEDSLLRLNREYIDLYQLHWYDYVTPIDELMVALERLKKQGKIRNIGCTNIPHDLIVQAGRTARLESVQLQYCLNDLRRQEDIHLLNNKYDMTTLVYGVLGRGIFSGKYQINSQFPEDDTRNKDTNFNENLEKNLQLLECVKEIGLKYSRTPSQVVIRWTLGNSAVSCALLGMKNISQVLDNVGALGWSLDMNDQRRLTEVASRLFS